MKPREKTECREGLPHFLSRSKRYEHIYCRIDTNMLVVTKYSVETINPLKYCLMEFLPFPFLRIKNKYEHFSRHGWTFNDHLFSYVLVCTSSHRKKLSASCQWNVAQVWLNHGMIKTTKNFSERKKKNVYIEILYTFLKTFNLYWIYVRRLLCYQKCKTIIYIWLSERTSSPFDETFTENWGGLGKREENISLV